jgi:sialate O-acetylesterase
MNEPRFSEKQSRPPRAPAPRAIIFVGALTLATFACAAAADPVGADPIGASHVSLFPLFSDHIVLQRRQPIPIWGTADPTSGAVLVSINGHSASASVDADGHWRATLPPLEAGGPYELSASSIVIHDVLVGDVFLASGQSNMSYPVSQEVDAPVPAPDADIRFCIERMGKHDPLGTPAHVSWERQQPVDARASAVAMYFAEAMRERTQVPIGIIEAADGGTNGEAWASLDALTKDPQLLEDAANQERLSKGSERLIPASRFDAMILPIVPFAISDVLWYQGEQNTYPALHPQHYQRLLTLLIDDWRRRWGYDVPFYIVQLHNVGTSQDPNGSSGFVQVREAQANVAHSLPKTSLVVTIDTGDGEMHPPDKWDVGHRLAMAVFDHRSGPTFDRVEPDGTGLRIRFRGVVNGLKIPSSPINGFWIADQSRRFVKATARIDGTSVVISSPSISSPLAARYAWSDNPKDLNLFDGSGLPAAPFRTDDW